MCAEADPRAVAHAAETHGPDSLQERSRTISARASSRPGRLADEILVADSLSTDNTLELVRQLGGCRIIQREFVDYANFKNWAIPQASHPWVLVLDADERVTEPLAAEIRQILARDEPSLDAYRMRRDNFFLGRRIRHCGWNRSQIVRLFRRDVCRYGTAQGPRAIGSGGRQSGNAPRQIAPLHVQVAVPVDGKTQSLRQALGRGPPRRRPPRQAGWEFSPDPRCGSSSFTSSAAAFSMGPRGCWSV